MAEYIEREALLEKIEETPVLKYGIPSYVRDSMITMVQEFPAADVAPVVHAKWGTGRFNLETGNYEEQCAHCRNFSKEYGKPYCPNCGAKMDGGDGNEAD